MFRHSGQEPTVELAPTVILFVSLLVLVSIVSSTIGSRLGLPVLLVYLVFGMAAGEEGPGGIAFDDVLLAYVMGSAALAVILFDGGLRTNRQSFRVGLRPALVLSTFGVLVTAGITATAAWWALEISWLEAWLVGAIVGSTDAAAVFSVLRGQGLALQQRVGATLEIESGANDPMAVFLTVVMVAAVTAGSMPGASVFGWFVWQMLFGAVVGGVGGYALAWALLRLPLNAALYPLLVLFGALAIFGLAAVAQASGFLAVYIAGLVVAKRVSRGLYNLEKFLDGIAWLAQIGMFLMLGLLVTPSKLIPIALDALFVGLVLMLVARPIAVVLSLAPFRFAWREQLFVSWVGLRGAVPIILAMFPLIGGVPNPEIYFDLAFFVVLLSLILQGWTVAPLARLLRLQVPSRSSRLQRIELGMPGQEEIELLGYEIQADSRVANQPFSQIRWPGISRPLVAVRGHELMPAADLTTLQGGDLLYLIAPPKELTPLDNLLMGEHGAMRIGEQHFFGEFTIEPSAPLGALAGVYGFEIEASLASASIGEMLLEQFPQPVVGDRVQLGDVEFTVREMADEEILKVGLKLPAVSSSG